MSNVLKILDVSTNHLPENLAGLSLIGEYGGLEAESQELNELLGATTFVHPRGHGFICWVPGEPDTEENIGVPAELARVFEYARQHDCSFVNFDADGDVCGDLPTWEW